MREFALSVIIPTYNRREILEQTLEALEEQTMDKDLFEVVVVNDGSTDDTLEFLERYKNRAKLHFTYLSKENEGQGIARNRGVEASDGHVILFLGDDSIPLPDFLEEHKRVHDKFSTENFMCLGHTTWHPSLQITPYMLFLESIGMQFKYADLERSKIIDPELGVRFASHKYFYTINISLKRNLFEKQKFDERFKKYGWEDIELGYRLEKEEGAILLYHNRAKTYHMHQLDDSELEKRMKQIGKNARMARKINPQVKTLPSMPKRLLFRVLSNPLVLTCIKGLVRPEHYKQHTLAWQLKLYYFALMKKYFLKGMGEVKRR